MSEYIKISPEIRALGREAEREIRPYFERLEEICDRNTCLLYTSVRGCRHAGRV